MIVASFIISGWAIAISALSLFLTWSKHRRDKQQ